MKMTDDGGENKVAGRRSGDLDELLGEYFGELESQREHARTRFLRKHPRFRSELLSFFDDYDQLDAWTENLRARSEHIDLMGQMLSSAKPIASPATAPNATLDGCDDEPS